MTRKPRRSRISFRMARAISLRCDGQRGRHGLDPGQRLADRQAHDLADVQAADFHRQRLGLQPVAMAGAAGPVVLVALHLLARPRAVGLAVAAVEVGDDALERARDLVDAAALVIAEADLLASGAVEQHLLRICRQVAPALGLVEAVVGGQRLDGLAVVGRLALGPRGDGAAQQRQALVGDDEAGVEEELDPEAVARRAGAERRVEREQARLDLRDGEAGDRAGELLGEGDALGLRHLRPPRRRAGRSRGWRCRRRGRGRCAASRPGGSRGPRAR